MGHDATKVLMGSTGSSSKQGSENYPSDPATFVAGLAVRRNSSNLLSLSSADGRWAGISLGRTLSDFKRTCVLESGEKVPVLVEGEPARGTVVITSYADLISTSADTITVGTTGFVAQSGSVTAGQATFQAATSNNATAASLAAQINAHATAGALVKATVSGATITLTAKINTSAGNSIVLSYTDASPTSVGATVSGSTLTGGGLASDFVVVGQHVYFSNTTGKADDPNSDSSISNAIYASGVLTGIQEDGTTAAAAYVDMAGGL